MQYHSKDRTVINLLEKSACACPSKLDEVGLVKEISLYLSYFKTRNNLSACKQIAHWGQSRQLVCVLQSSVHLLKHINFFKFLFLYSSEKKSLGRTQIRAYCQGQQCLQFGNSYTLFILFNVCFHLQKAFLVQTLHKSPQNYSQSSYGQRNLNWLKVIQFAYF